VKAYENILKVYNLRGHTNNASMDNYEVDLRAMFIKYDDKIYVIPGSSIKGLIRKNMKILNCDTSVLGSEFGEKSMTSKVIVSWGYITEEKKKKVRYGIRVNKELGIVEKGALFSYEIIPENLEIRFDIIPIVDLTNKERECLRKALLLMRYSTIGWGGSKGIGIVEEVKLDDALLS
jgi:CRISPR/Cas system CSM-associated protein Csm3 (group 7 of RAMP superfamily)